MKVIDDGEDIEYIEQPIGVISQTEEPYLEFDEKEKKNYLMVSGTIFSDYSKAAEILEKENIFAEVISVNTIKPLDVETIVNSVKKTKCVVTCENSNIKGGLYSAVSEALSTNYPSFVIPVGVEDEFGQVGKYNDLLKAYHLTPTDIVEKVKIAINKK